MSDLDAMIPAPDHSHGAHGHGTGHKWLDILVAVSAVFISIVSLIVSIEHGRTMEKMVDQNEKMVEASTLPLLSEAGSMFDGKDNRVERIILSNDGMGPAIIKSFEVRYKGVSYSSQEKLFQACCADALAQIKGGINSKGIYYSNVSGLVLAPHDTKTPIDIENAPSNLLLMNAFEQARADGKIELRACYCSVLNKCWQTVFERQFPTPVAECKATPESQLW